jgi:hypothetical protein
VIANRYAGQRHLSLVIGLTATWIPVGQIIAALMAAGFDTAKETASLPSIWQPLWIVAALSALLFIFFCRRHSEGLANGGPDRGAAGGRAPLEKAELHSLILAAAVFLLWSAQYFAFMTWLPQYLVESRGLPERLALWGYLLPLMVLVAANIATGGLLRAGIAPGATLLLGLILQAGSWWLMPVGGDAGGALVGIGLLLLYGLGAGITPTSLFAMPSTILGGGGAGGLATAFAVLMTGRNLGIVIGPLLLAQIFAVSGSLEAGKPVFAVLGMANVLLAVFLALRLRRD